jgi:hypothetical protein
MSLSKSFLLYIFIAATYSNVSIASNGWSSSGGGEYIVTEGNPWFVGTQSVSWCINHGGVKNFSLSAELSKVEVEKAIVRLTNQIKTINKYRTNLDYNGLFGNTIDRKCVLSFEQNGKNKNWTNKCDHLGEGFLLSDNFSYVENCNNADLEIILGNIDDPKIKKLYEDLGETRFRNLAGIAMRTNYDQSVLRGKGFIYIAADLGKLGYAGQRSIYLKGNTIWNYHNSIPEKTKFPPNVINSFWNKNPTKYTFKESTLGALQPVVAHEFGHVLGLKHTNSKDLMDADYPAEVVKNGLIFYGNYIRNANVFSDQMLEEDMDRRVAFEYNVCGFEGCEESNLDLESNNPFLAKLFIKTGYKDIEDRMHDFYSQKLLLVFDTIFEQIEDDKFKQKGTLAIYRINKDTLAYDERVKLPTEYSFCDYNNVYQYIKVRVENKYTGLPTQSLDPKTGNWIEGNPIDYTENDTFTLLGLRARDLCGQVNDEDGKAHFFRLSIDNHNKVFNIKFLNKEFDENSEWIFNLERSHLSNSFKFGIPEPRPEYYFQVK